MRFRATHSLVTEKTGGSADDERDFAVVDYFERPVFNPTPRRRPAGACFRAPLIDPITAPLIGAASGGAGTVALVGFSDDVTHEISL